MSGRRAGATLRHASLPLVVGLLAGAAWYVFSGAQAALRHRDAVVLAPLAGAGAETARLTDQLAAALADLTAARGVPLRRLGAPVTGADGSPAGRAPGDREGAALIVWGYVTPAGSDAVATLIVEPRDRPRSLILRPFGDYAVEGTLAGPERFILRQPIDGDAAAAARLVDALLRSRAGRDAEADGLLEDLTRRAHPDDRAAFLLSRGHLALLMAMPQRALRLYDEALADRSVAAAAHNGRGLALAVMGEQRRALAEYEAAAALDPEADAPAAHRGISLTFGGQYHQAIAIYDAVLGRRARAPAALLGRGVAWAALGDHARAAADFSSVLAVAPDPLAYFDRGLSDAARGRHRQAIDDFSRALQRRPADPAILVSRGRSRSALKDQTGAIADFTAALDLDPRMPAAYYERGIARTIFGQVAEAIDDFSAAIRLKPRFGDAYKGRGVGQLLRREYARALEDFDRAIAIDPKDAEAYYHHGITLRLRGEPRKAIPDMERVLEISPDPSLRRQAQEQLRQIRAEP